MSINDTLKVQFHVQ